MSEKVNNSHSQVNILNEMRLDNEISKIIHQERSPYLYHNKNLMNINETSQEKIMNGIHQESTNIATDKNTVRVSIKAHFDSVDQNLPTSASREIGLNEHEILENSPQNEDLLMVKENEEVEQNSEKLAPNEQFLKFISDLMDSEAVSNEDIITEIEKQVLIENKDFEDELDEIKSQCFDYDTEIRELKKQKYCIVWPNNKEGENYPIKDHIIDKNHLQEEFLHISNDVRREVLKTRFVNGLPSSDTQMGLMNHSKSRTTLREDNNIQGILDLVVTNDDLLNKFFDIIFNSDNQALKLPNVHRGDNKT